MSSTQTTNENEIRPDSAHWIADATRRLAGFDGSDSEPPAIDSARGAEALLKLRGSIAERVAALPRSARLVRTRVPNLELTELALSRALAVGLAEAAAHEGAAIADVDVSARDRKLVAVRIVLVAVSFPDRPHTLLEGGDELRRSSAALLKQRLGIDHEVRVDITWKDYFADGTQ